MSKLEILNKQNGLIEWVRESGLNANDWDIIRDSAVNSMEEYAKQVAIGFTNWLTRIDSPYAVMYGGFPERWADEKKDYTTEELFELYIKTLEQCHK